MKEYPKYIGDMVRRNNPENQKYYRRHGFGENTEEGSDAAELIVNDQIWFQIATTVKWKYSCAVLGLAACHVSQNWNSRYVTPASQSHISHECSPLRWAISCKHEIAPLLLGLKKGEDRRKKKREVLHLLRCYTHTHPARAGSTLKGKRKKKADTRRANGQKQRRGGGEQTDLRNQPTRRNGPEQNSAHT